MPTYARSLVEDSAEPSYPGYQSGVLTLSVPRPATPCMGQRQSAISLFERGHRRFLLKAPLCASSSAWTRGTPVPSASAARSPLAPAPSRALLHHCGGGRTESTKRSQALTSRTNLEFDFKLLVVIPAYGNSVGGGRAAHCPTHRAELESGADDPLARSERKTISASRRWEQSRG